MRLSALLLTAVLLFAQVPSRVSVGYDSIQGARLKADLTVAIQWIASEFARAGLKPANGDSFLQPVPLIECTMDQVTDTVEKINSEKMTRILKLAHLAGSEFADAEKPPKLEPRARSRGSE